VLDALGSNVGTITKIHQREQNLESYQHHLEMIEYDMLYGKMVSFGGVSPYLPTNMQMGVYDIYVTDVVHNNGQLFVYGNKFNENSKILLNGKTRDTYYLNPNCLAIDLESTDNIDTLQILQITYDRIELRRSAEYALSSFIEPIISEETQPTE
jgi:hypothetical protein